VLAEALIHSLRGFDEEGISALHEIEEIAAPDDDHVRSQAHAELGYVDFLRARYDRSVKWLTSALDGGAGSAMIRARASTYLGSVESDRANYARARELLDDGQRLASSIGLPRVEAYALSMLGRVHLLVGDLDAADACLEEAVRVAEGDHWLAFLPWPQALRGEVALARNDPDAAGESLRHAFARACQLGDPCWEGLSSRGLAILAEATGEVEQAFDLLADARKRSNRFSDPYVWLDGHILDAQCDLGIRHGHPDTSDWVSEMKDLTSRTDMKELLARAMLHGAQLGNPGDASAAALLAGEIDNPLLAALVSRHTQPGDVASVT
jgi:tetratricopeptide (TPR) repeat protein